MQGLAGRDDPRLMTATAGEALELARAAGDEELILASRSATVVHVGARDWLPEYQDIRTNLEQRADPIALKEHYWHGMWTSRTLGEFELCIEVCDGGMRIADRLGVAPVMYPTIKALALLDLGRFGDAAESLAQEVVAEPFGVAMQKLGEAAYFTEVHAFEEGAAAARESLALADRFRRRWMQGLSLGYLVRSLLGEGRSAEASEEYTAVSPPPDLATRSSGRLRGVICAEVLAAEGDADAALDEIDRHIERADRLGLRRDLTLGRECRSRLLLLADRYDDAASEADRCIDDASATGFRTILWRGYAARARARAALGDRRGADEDRGLAFGEVRELAASIPDGALAARFLGHSDVVAATD
jgi:tetratricopeptide (TPR) repeat protein